MCLLRRGEEEGMLECVNEWMTEWSDEMHAWNIRFRRVNIQMERDKWTIEPQFVVIAIAIWSWRMGLDAFYYILLVESL